MRWMVKQTTDAVEIYAKLTREDIMHAPLSQSELSVLKDDPQSPQEWLAGFALVMRRLMQIDPPRPVEPLVLRPPVRGGERDG